MLCEKGGGGGGPGGSAVGGGTCPLAAAKCLGSAAAAPDAKSTMREATIIAVMLVFAMSAFHPLQTFHERGN